MIRNASALVLSSGNDFDIFHTLGKAFDSTNGIKSSEANTALKRGHRATSVANKSAIVVPTSVKIRNLRTFMS